MVGGYSGPSSSDISRSNSRPSPPSATGRATRPSPPAGYTTGHSPPAGYATRPASGGYVESVETVEIIETVETSHHQVYYLDQISEGFPNYSFDSD